MWRLTRASPRLRCESLPYSPKGSARSTGELGTRSKTACFAWRCQFGAPIVPVTMVGAFDFNKKTSWLLRPGTITVVLHEVIETKDLRKEDFPALRDRIHAIISMPMEEGPDSGGKY